MEIYQTEEQQVEAIKHGWQRYKRLIISLLAVMVVFIGGVNYFRHHSSVQMEQASDIYQAMLSSVMQKDIVTAKANGELLLQGFSRTPYPQLSALMLAKIAVDENDLDVAEQHLRWTIDQSKAKGLGLHIAKVRLSRVLKEKGDLDGALAILSAYKIENDAYIPIYEEAKGDLYVLQGNIEEAKNSYTRALDTMPEGVQSPFLQMKIMDLGIDKD